MGVRLVVDQMHQVMYCSTSMTAFGPVFYQYENVDSFLKWLQTDPRLLSEQALVDAVERWREGYAEAMNESLSD